MVKFIIVSTGWKCEDTIERCVESVNNQTYKRWFHKISIDEAEDDGYIEEEKRTVFTNIKGLRFGKMANFVLSVNHIRGDNNIICDLDLDDYLEPDALETVAQVYEENPETLMTHGSYRMESGKPARFNGAYTNENFRGWKWRGTHFKTFRASLFHRIKINDFKGPPDGKWLMSGSDMAMMFPMMEMAGLDRIKYIDKPIYVYNDLSPLNDHKTDPELQKTVERYLRRKKTYRRI